MKKEDIIREINNLDLQEDYVLGMGGSLCMRDIRDTHDIDLGVHEKDFKRLAKNQEIAQAVLGQQKIVLTTLKGDEIEVFNYEDFDGEGTEIIDGIQCQTIEGIIKMKKRFNRPKDIKDLELIYATL